MGQDTDGHHSDDDDVAVGATQWNRGDQGQRPDEVPGLQGGPEDSEGDHDAGLQSQRTAQLSDGVVHASQGWDRAPSGPAPHHRDQGEDQADDDGRADQLVQRDPTTSPQDLNHQGDR